jgi:hypothetical protein
VDLNFGELLMNLLVKFSVDLVDTCSGCGL